jgi:ABC-2 type transport system permease protein
MATIRPRNVLLIARREYLVRARTRSFKLATAFLVVGAFALALAPVLIRLVEGGTSGDRVGIASTAQLPLDPVGQFTAILDVPTITGTGPAYAFSAVADPADGRARVERDELNALVQIDRDAAGELTFLIVSKDGVAARTPTLLRQAAAALAIQDRLARQGISPTQQAALFAAPVVTVERPVPGERGGAPSDVNDLAAIIVGQILVIFIFIAIILYGQWVAMSVAEEKSSRVVEIVISAATPEELLAGKVVGVGGLGLTQYVAAVIPAVLAYVLQGRIADALLGSTVAATPSAGSGGLTPVVMITFGILLILGFMLYATLYAAAGSLVSRMEDVNSVVAPMMMLGMVGYFVAVYASSGLIPIDAGWVIAFSFVPFVSPYLMLSRVVLGVAGPFDVALAVAILLVSILGALWVAARVYRAGLLTYGQKAGFRTFVRAAFGSGR